MKSYGVNLFPIEQDKILYIRINNRKNVCRSYQWECYINGKVISKGISYQWEGIINRRSYHWEGHINEKEIPTGTS